jgi:hypothetical protein
MRAAGSRGTRRRRARLALTAGEAARGHGENGQPVITPKARAYFDGLRGGLR